MPLVTFDDRNVANYQAYSTSEVDTGCKWTNGKTIYRIVITGTTGSSNGTVYISTSSMNIDEVIDLKANCIYSAPSGIVTSGYWGSSSDYFNAYYTGGAVAIHQAGYTSKSVTVILEYTKTTD